MQNYENPHASLGQTLTTTQLGILYEHFSFKWNTGLTDFIILLS